MGPIFRERVIAPPSDAGDRLAADALAVTLNELGRVDPDHLAELLECAPRARQWRNSATPCSSTRRTEEWETADAYLSGPVRHKLAAAEAAAALDGPLRPQRRRAARRCSPRDIQPSDITARLGAPWLPTDVIEAFVREVMGGDGRDPPYRRRSRTWTVISPRLRRHRPRGTSEWGTARRHAGQLLHDALNSCHAADLRHRDRGRQRAPGAEPGGDRGGEGEAAQDQDGLHATGCGPTPDRADRLSRLYNDRFNNLVPRHFDGSHLTAARAPATSSRFYPHQKRAIWRIVADGSTYIAHAVGAGKTFTMAAAIMEQRRLGLVQQGDAGRARPLPGPGVAASSCSSTRPPASWSPTRPISPRTSAPASWPGPRPRAGTPSSSPTPRSSSSPCPTAFERGMIEDADRQTSSA